MSDPNADEASLAVAAALLDQGRALHLASAALTLAASVPAPAAPGVGGALLAIAALMTFGTESWFAARVGLDARLFHRLAAGTLDLGALDQGLVNVGLLGAEPAPRSVIARIHGARRLFVVQACLVAVQAAVAGLAFARLLLAGAS
jgi:hypothetical protein